MAEYQGVAKLDLTGNRVIWKNGTETHDQIKLVGSHFRGTVEMATIVVSGLCGVAFLAMVFSLCYLSYGRGKTSQYLPWATVWIPMLCMIG